MYEGQFVEGKRQGHGVLKQGRLNSDLAAIYVGEWQADDRHGYGVLDDIIKGNTCSCQCFITCSGYKM